MTRRSIRFCTLLACLVLIHSFAAAQGGLTIVGVSGTTIRTIDMVSGGSQTSFPITIPGKTVSGTYGVARDPQSGTVYVVLSYTTVGGRFLATVDPTTGAGTNIAATAFVADIAFGADGTLYAIGGNLTGIGGVLFAVDKATGTATQILSLSGGSGQVLAFNPEDGLLYHGSNSCDAFNCFFNVERLDPQIPTDPESVSSLFNPGIESGGFAHLRGSYFLVGGNSFPAQFALLNAATGAVVYLNADTSWSGLTTIPSGGTCPPVATLYATGPFEGPSMLHAIDPATGAATFVGVVGFNNVTGLDFAADAVLYAIGTRADDGGVQVLLTIDPCTGQGTEVGPTGRVLREMVAAAGGELYSYSGQNFSSIDRVTGAATTIGNSGITADDFGLEYSPTDDKLYFTNIFNAIGTLYSIDPATGSSSVVSGLTLPPNITALRAMDFNPGNSTMYALISDSAFPGTTSLATVDTSAHSVSIVGTTNRFATLAFKDGTASANYQLTVIKQGAGAGSVTSTPNGIDCGTTCEFAFATGTQVLLTATPAADSAFTGWSGACQGEGACLITMAAMRTARANFEPLIHVTVTYGAANLGSGVVLSNGTGGPCDLGVPQGCVYSYIKGAGAMLTPVGDSPSTFVSWGGVCAGQSVPCTFLADSDKAVEVNFSAVRHLMITIVNPVANDPVIDGNRSCSSGTCDFRYAVGDAAFLHFTMPEPVTPKVIGQFSGDCTGLTCSLTMNTDHAATATFVDGFDVVATLAGNGSGIVSNLNCFDTTCSNRFLLGTPVTMTGIADPGSAFDGWSGACTGTGACQVSSNTVTTIQLSATFSLLAPQTLSVSKTGSGAGTVTSSPAGIDCGATCSIQFADSTFVTLTATPAAGSVFSGWSGDCSGTGVCQVTMDQARNVAATFTGVFTIDLSRSGNGFGLVTPDSGQFTCDVTCTATYAVGTTVTLSAAASPGSTFTGWSGACTGTSTCLITSNVPATISVAAGFDLLPPQTLIVSKAGNGSGTVSSNPGGIACGLTCNAQFAPASMVTLSATPATGTNFATWSGDCAGSVSVCQVSMTTARNVTATFTLQSFTLNVAAAGTGAGTITGTGINCPNTCSVANVFGTMLTLTATPNAESSFTGWSGACTGTGACQVTFDAAKNVTANFAFIGPFNFANTSLPLSVPAGQPGVFSLSIQEHTASSGTITFTCVSGLPAGSACSFNPNGIAFTAGANTTINTLLTITTLPRTIGMNDEPGRGMNPIWAISLFAWIFVVPRRRRRQALMMLALALVMLLPACGGGGHSTTKTQSGTAAGTYTVVVNGSTGSAVKTTTVTLVVQ